MASMDSSTGYRSEKVEKHIRARVSRGAASADVVGRQAITLTQPRKFFYRDKNRRKGKEYTLYGAEREIRRPCPENLQSERGKSSMPQRQQLREREGHRAASAAPGAGCAEETLGNEDV